MADEVVSNTIALIKRAGSSPASSTRNYVSGFLTAYCPLDYESAQIIIEKHYAARSLVIRERRQSSTDQSMLGLANLSSDKASIFYAVVTQLV